MAQQVEYEGLNGYLAQADGPAGVLIQPSHFGLNEIARGWAHSLAEAGLTTVIWNQYSGRPKLEPAPDEAVAWGKELKDDVALRQNAAWLGYMFGELGLRSVGVMGFCQGGRFALLVAATDRRVSACVSYYPTLTSPMKPNHDLDAVAIAGDIHCAVQLIYPGSDHATSRETFNALRANLDGRQAPTTTHIYPSAEHGFLTHPDKPENQQATRLSWPLAVAFLQAHLAPAR
ncbi:MAG TPA: dienelactone hydrolase family protein [Chloroflexota bacterium]|nr:dienelactone hydrolase family protein [Chloroflexota bacterium]